MTVNEDFHYDRCKLTSGFGNNQHTGHPKLTSCEVQSLPHTAPEQEKDLQHYSGSIAAPVNSYQRHMDKITSLQHSKHATNKISESSVEFYLKNIVVCFYLLMKSRNQILQIFCNMNCQLL